MSSKFIKINQNGSKDFFITKLDGVGDIKIEQIKVNAKFKGFIFIPVLPSYSMLDESNKTYHFHVKILNSPQITCEWGSRVEINLDITYSCEGEVYNELFENDNSGQKLKCSNNDIPQRRYAANILKLDSIYRPFFVNAVLLLLPNEFRYYTTDIENSKKCLARLYYSIANGCTFRKKSNENNNYYIGDIDVRLNHADFFNFKIRDSYRTFSEIEEIPKRGSVFEKIPLIKHLTGIKESGYMNGNSVNDVDIKGGINLYPEEINNKTIYPSMEVDSYGLVSSVSYVDESNKNLPNLQDLHDDNIEKLSVIDTTVPIDFKISVNDYAPLGYEPNNITVESKVLFPDEIRYNGGIVEYDAKFNDINIMYIGTNDLNSLFQNFDSINVNDDINKVSYEYENGNTFTSDSFFKFLEQNNENGINLLDFQLDSGVYKYDINDSIKYVIAIHHGSVKNEDKDNLFSYVKHTNKALIIKVYRIK